MTAADEPVAHLVRPADAHRIQGPVGGPMFLALHGDRTGGRLFTLEVEVAPGDGPPHHWHEEQDEAWYVLEGDIRFRMGDDVHTVEPGTWAYVPRGTAHCFQNVGREAARMLVIFTPAGMEPFFEAFASVPLGPGRAQAFVDLGEPCGMHTVGPPLAQSHPS